jgi:hypothetical protein
LLCRRKVSRDEYATCVSNQCREAVKYRWETQRSASAPNHVPSATTQASLPSLNSNLLSPPRSVSGLSPRSLSFPFHARILLLRSFPRETESPAESSHHHPASHTSSSPSNSGRERSRSPHPSRLGYRGVERFLKCFSAWRKGVQDVSPRLGGSGSEGMTRRDETRRRCRIAKQKQQQRQRCARPTF